MGLANQSNRWPLASESGGLHSGRAVHRLHQHHDASTSGVSLMDSMLLRLDGAISSMGAQLDSMLSGSDVSSASVVSTSMGAQVINKQRGELQIRTQEGDLVTLKFSNKVSTSIAGRVSGSGSTEVMNAGVEMRSHSRMSISVTGSLNDDELQAIYNLADEVGELTERFFSGNVDQALSQAMNLDYDSSQLADYSLDLRLKQSVRAYATYTAMSLPPPPSVTQPSPQVEVSEQAAEPIVQMIDSATAEATESVQPATEGDTASLVEPLAAEPTAAATDAKAVLTEFVSRVRATFNMKAGDGSLGFSYEFKAKLLIARIADSAPAISDSRNAALTYLDQQIITSAG
jgi:hypothetical protein